jgi:serine/threonine-protein kinase
MPIVVLDQIIDGKYQIVRMLGQGGMGTVYEAKHTETARRVALKVIGGGLVNKSADTAARFKREAKAAGALETQHAIQVLDAGSDPITHDPYIVMELLNGEDLKQLIHRVGPLAPELALRIAGQACVGLQVAHDAGIIHRDIKSANLFLARRETDEIVVKIVDFGIAKIVEEHAAAPGDKANLTSTGSLVGSPRYVSPEQAKGTRDVGVRSDLWSLGVVLYELLTGTTPHAEIDGVFMIMTAICSTPAPPVQERAPWVPAEIAELTHKLLEIDPAKRFASASATLKAIRALLPGGLSIDAGMIGPLPTGARESVVPSVPGRSTRIRGDGQGDSETALNVITRSRIPSTRSRRWSAALFVAALAGGALTAYGLSRRAAPPSAAVEDTLSPSSRSSSPEPTGQPVSAPPPEEQHARLLIEPADATVEIDGHPVSVKDGAAELSGVIGSVHHVRVRKGTGETRLDVALTAQGVVPPSVKVEAAPPPTAPRPPIAVPARPPSVQPSAPPSAQPSARPDKPRELQPATKFE